MYLSSNTCFSFRRKASYPFMFQSVTHSLTNGFLCVCLPSNSILKCQVPFFPLFDDLNGWARVCQHLPVQLYFQVHLTFPASRNTWPLSVCSTSQSQKVLNCFSVYIKYECSDCWFVEQMSSPVKTITTANTNFVTLLLFFIPSLDINRNDQSEANIDQSEAYLEMAQEEERHSLKSITRYIIRISSVGTAKDVTKKLMWNPRRLMNIDQCEESY